MYTGVHEALTSVSWRVCIRLTGSQHTWGRVYRLHRCGSQHDGSGKGARTRVSSALGNREPRFLSRCETMPRFAASLFAGPVNRFGGGCPKSKACGKRAPPWRGSASSPKARKNLGLECRRAITVLFRAEMAPTEGCVVPAPSSPGARHAVRDQEAPLSPHTLPRWARPCLGGKKIKQSKVLE
ncbi:hypothetical protein MRX96_030976 [Rhipicephalus microplus]